MVLLETNAGEIIRGTILLSVPGQAIVELAQGFRKRVVIRPDDIKRIMKWDAHEPKLIKQNPFPQW